MAILLLLVQELTSYYISQGYFLSKAYIPAQKLKDGIIKINIAEGNINKVEVNVNEPLESEDIEDRFTGLKMKVISENKSLKEHCLS
jgi:hemolysin activation/secretion protein|tara:strand:- start:165 stop:425 length:261 start_codon:yes stop_codon:yes gene_type:complete